MATKRSLEAYDSARYQSEDWECGMNDSAAQKITDLTGGAADIYTWRLPVNVAVVDLKFWVTTAVAADTVAPVVRAEERNADGGGAAVIASITIPDGSAAGSIVSATAFAEHKVDAGHLLVLRHQTAAVDAGVAAGAGILFVCIREPVPAW